VAISVMWLEAVPGDPAIPYSGQQLRRLIQGIAPLEGVVLRGDFNVSQRAGGANFSVDVATGTATVLCDTIALGGMYLAWSDTVVNVPIAVPPLSGTRTDLVILHVHDKQSDGGVGYNGAVEVIGGTVGQPAPAVPLGAIALAEVTVAAGQASVATTNVADRRMLNTLGDVPLWEVSGGNGQVLPNVTTTLYSGWTVSDSIGTLGVTVNNGAVIAQPGRYLTTFSTRLNIPSGTGDRHLAVRQLRNGVRIRQVPSGNAFQGLPVMSLATTFRCQRGDVMQATIFQNTGGQLNIDDSFGETVFSGVYVGP